MKEQNYGMANQQQTNAELRELALFAGAGGGILGGKLLGWRTVCAVEWDAYAASVLVSRQNDGCLEAFPVWDDVQTFDGKPWRGIVDVVSGGFPCTDISCAGKGAGIDGKASSMWRHMARIIGEVRPRYAFVENSPMLTLRGLDRVLGDLSTLGYDARWGVVGACHAGAPHRRERIWILANSEKLQRNGSNNNSRVSMERESISKLGNYCWQENVANPSSKRQSKSRSYWYASDPAETKEGETDRAWSERVGYIWGIKSRLGRVADGVANRANRLKAIGNGQVPIVAATAWRILGGE